MGAVSRLSLVSAHPRQDAGQLCPRQITTVIGERGELDAAKTPTDKNEYGAPITVTGRLMLNVLSSVAEFERSIMLERQREGVAKAKADGKYKGRAPTAQAKAREVAAMLASGKGPTDVAKALKIGRSSVYRVMRARGLRKTRIAYVSETVDQSRQSAKQK